MRAFRFLNVAVLSTLVATSAVLYAQDEKAPEAKPPRQEEARPEPRPEAPKQEEKAPKPNQEMKPAQQGDMRPDAPRQEEAKPSKEEQKAQKQQEKQEKDQAKHNQENRDTREAAQNNDNHARPAGKGGHIPDDKFRSHFGNSHKFVIQRTTVQGQSGFVYGGYSFVFVDPWPVGWAYTDDCYVDYIDGEYFLFDLLHPGVRIALFVVL